MSYIIKVFDLDRTFECENEEVACEIAYKIRRLGHPAVAVDSEAPEVGYLVSGDGVKDVHIIAHSATEAICLAQFNTDCKAYNTAALEVPISVVVTRPDGDVDVIVCICLDEAKKYLRRYNDRGWPAVLQLG